jgi:hypothetical protein
MRNTHIKSVFKVQPRRNVCERRSCKGCGKSLFPRNQSNDVNFCRTCYKTLESAFTSTRILHHFVEKPVLQKVTVTEYIETPVKVLVDTHEERTRVLKESRLTAVQHSILQQERIDGLKIMVEQRDAKITHLRRDNKRLKRQRARDND